MALYIIALTTGEQDRTQTHSKQGTNDREQGHA
jgi:hypothetical protein